MNAAGLPGGRLRFLLHSLAGNPTNRWTSQRDFGSNHVDLVAFSEKCQLTSYFRFNEYRSQNASTCY
jgi:hypothetical protein